MATAATTIELRFGTRDLKEVARQMKEIRRDMAAAIRENTFLDSASKRRLQQAVRDQAGADRELLARAKQEINLERRARDLRNAGRAASDFADVQDRLAPALQAARGLNAVANGGLPSAAKLLGRFAGPAALAIDAVLLIKSVVEPLIKAAEERVQARIGAELRSELDRARVELDLEARFKRDPELQERIGRNVAENARLFRANRGNYIQRAVVDLSEF